MSPFVDTMARPEKNSFHCGIPALGARARVCVCVWCVCVCVRVCACVCVCVLLVSVRVFDVDIRLGPATKLPRPGLQVKESLVYGPRESNKQRPLNDSPGSSPWRESEIQNMGKEHRSLQIDPWFPSQQIASVSLHQQLSSSADLVDVSETRHRPHTGRNTSWPYSTEKQLLGVCEIRFGWQLAG